MKNQLTKINDMREKLFWLSANYRDDSPLSYLTSIQQIISAIEEIELIRSEGNEELKYIYRNLSDYIKDFAHTHTDGVTKAILNMLADHFDRRAKIIKNIKHKIK